MAFGLSFHLYAALEHYTALEAEREKRIRKSKELAAFIAMLKKQPLAVAVGRAALDFAAGYSDRASGTAGLHFGLNAAQ